MKQQYEPLGLGLESRVKAEPSRKVILFIAQFYAEWRVQNISNRQIAKQYFMDVKQLKKHLKAVGVEWIQ